MWTSHWDWNLDSSFLQLCSTSFEKNQSDGFYRTYPSSNQGYTFWNKNNFYDSGPQVKEGRGDSDGLCELASSSASGRPGSEVGSVVSSTSSVSSMNSKLDRIVKQLTLVKQIQNTPTPAKSTPVHDNVVQKDCSGNHQGEHVVGPVDNTPSSVAAQSSPVGNAVDQKKVNQVLAKLKAMKGVPTVEKPKSTPVNEKQNPHIIPPYVPWLLIIDFSHWKSPQMIQQTRGRYAPKSFF